MLSGNPFSDNKIEYEDNPILWFSTRSRRIAERGRSTYINGTRGSGKTSILRSLSSRYIFEIPSLQQQLSSKRLHWLGTYVRLQDTFSELLIAKPELKNLPPPTDAAKRGERFVVFAQYIELMLLASFCSDLTILRSQGHLRFSFGSERDAIERLLAEVAGLRAYTDGRVIETLADLETLSRNVLQRLFALAINVERRIPTSAFNTTIPGSILSGMAKCILPIVRGERFQQAAKLKLKLLVDDCESLPLEHQIYLNTLVRASETPCSWVIAFVGVQYDSGATIRKAQRLTDADREIEFLDQTREAEFKLLCERVASLRLYRKLAPALENLDRIGGPNDCFNLEERLGKLSLNQLVHATLSNSLKPEADAIRKKAGEWQALFDRAQLRREDRSVLEMAEGDLPFTTAVAAEGLSISIESAEREIYDDRSRKVLRQRLARKQRAAFLKIGLLLDVNMLLGGERIIIALSDGCIRDFLDIMREVFERVIGDGEYSSEALHQFVASRRPVSLDDQSRAVYAASHAKVRGIATIADPFGAETTRMVAALGALTHSLQTGPGSMQNPELGIFKVHWRSVIRQLQPFTDFEQLLKLFDDAMTDGFLREVTDRDAIVSALDSRAQEYRYFRLHRRFAPAYGFSFRGPYGVYSVRDGPFLELLIAREQFGLSEWVSRVMSARDNEPLMAHQPELPGLDAEDE